jgi:YbbR domain-containing protein
MMELLKNPWFWAVLVLVFAAVYFATVHFSNKEEKTA